MTVNERNKVLEVVDILRALGGHNGFSNLQPKVKKILLGYANDLKDIVERDVNGGGVVSEEHLDEEIETINI